VDTNNNRQELVAPASEPRPRRSGRATERREMERSELLTVEEVAELLRLTSKGVYAMTSARRIPFVRVSNRIRFRRDEVDGWLDGNRVDVLTR
jgi:excisionase family DNA binding protein